MSGTSRRAWPGRALKATPSGAMPLAGTVRAQGAGFDQAPVPWTAPLRQHALHDIRPGEAP